MLLKHDTCFLQHANIFSSDKMTHEKWCIYMRHVTSHANKYESQTRLNRYQFEANKS